MRHIGIAGSGAFGTALAVAFATAGARVTLWGRDRALMAQVAQSRQTPRLSGVTLPDTISPTDDFQVLTGVDALLLAVPTQKMAAFLAEQSLPHVPLVTCAKGVEIATGRGPAEIVQGATGGKDIAVLTGPSFAADIARGLPTALTLACSDDTLGRRLQDMLSTPVLRLYLSTDVAGAELGGALKNVMAIASGIVIGAGLGESARAAIITRGFAEMQRFAAANGARPETLNGLSGLGDLVLTCTSTQSRNFRFGAALAQGQALDDGVTVEGAATARAVAALARDKGIDMPLTTMVAAVIEGKCTIEEAIKALLARPLKEE